MDPKEPTESKPAAPQSEPHPEKSYKGGKPIELMSEEDALRHLSEITTDLNGIVIPEGAIDYNHPDTERVRGLLFPMGGVLKDAEEKHQSEKVRDMATTI